MRPHPCPHNRALSRAGLLAFSVSLMLPLAQTVRAADGTWSTTTSGALWSSSGNWLSGTIADGSGFTADFSTLDITAATTVNLDSARTIGKLVFGDTSTSTVGSWTLSSSNVLTLAGTTPTITVNDMGNASYTNSTVTISAVIDGTQGLVKDGTGTVSTGGSSWGKGTLVLSGANTYSGGTTISSGALRAGTNSALGTGDVTVANGAQLQLDSSINIANTVNINGANALLAAGGGTILSGTVNLQSDSGIKLTSNHGNGSMTLSGTVNLNGFTLTASPSGSASSVTLSAPINGSGGITASGAGPVTISNNNTGYSGTTTVASNGAVLQVGNDGALGSGTLSIGSSTSGVTVRSDGSTARTLSNTVVFNTSGNATYTFGGSSQTGNLTFTNSTGIALGSVTKTLNILNTQTQFDAGFTGAGAITKSGAGTLVLNGANTYTGATTINAGTIQLGNGGATGSLATGSAISVASGATFAVKRSNAVIQGTDFKAGISGAGGFTQAGSGTTTLIAGNAYTGTTTVSAGTLALGANNAFAVSAFNLAGGTLAVGTFTNTAVGALTLTGNSAITLGSGGAFAFADSQSIDWGSNTLSITGTFVDGFSIRFGTDGNALTSGQLALISINGVGGVTLDGSGYLLASAIPEPAACSLLAGVGLLGFALWRRRPRA